MTRKKKSRSLKRIHSVKTGNASKLKRDAPTDRQNTNLKSKSKPKSVYQKFLDENPGAAEKQIQPVNNEAKAKNSKAAKTVVDKKAEKPVKERKSSKNDDDRKERNDEREPDLLSQLDNKNFNDFY